MDQHQQEGETTGGIGDLEALGSESVGQRHEQQVRKHEHVLEDQNAVLSGP